MPVPRPLVTGSTRNCSPRLTKPLGLETTLLGVTDVLAVIGTDEDERLVLDELGRRGADRVTVLLDEEATDWAADESDTGAARRDRLALLLHAIERRTGAAVVGTVGRPEQLRGWRFDRVVRGAPSAQLAA